MNELIQQYKPSTYCVPGHRQGPRPDGTRSAVERGSTNKGTMTRETSAGRAGKGPPVVWEGSTRARELALGSGELTPGTRKHYQRPSPHEAASCVQEPVDAHSPPNMLRWLLSLNPCGFQEQNSQPRDTPRSGCPAHEAWHRPFPGPTLHSMMANQEWRPSRPVPGKYGVSQGVPGRAPRRMLGA